MLAAKHTELKDEQQQTSPSKRQRAGESPSQPNLDARNEINAATRNFQRVRDDNTEEIDSSPPKRVRLDSKEAKIETTQLTHTGFTNEMVCFGQLCVVKVLHMNVSLPYRDWRCTTSVHKKGSSGWNHPWPSRWKRQSEFGCRFARQSAQWLWHQHHCGDEEWKHRRKWQRYTAKTAVAPAGKTLLGCLLNHAGFHTWYSSIAYNVTLAIAVTTSASSLLLNLIFITLASSVSMNRLRQRSRSAPFSRMAASALREHKSASAPCLPTRERSKSKSPVTPPTKRSC